MAVFGNQCQKVHYRQLAGL